MDISWHVLSDVFSCSARAKQFYGCFSARHRPLAVSSVLHAASCALCKTASTCHTPTRVRLAFVRIYQQQRRRPLGRLVPAGRLRAALSQQLERRAMIGLAVSSWSRRRQYPSWTSYKSTAGSPGRNASGRFAKPWCWRFLPAHGGADTRDDRRRSRRRVRGAPRRAALPLAAEAPAPRAAVQRVKIRCNQ